MEEGRDDDDDDRDKERVAAEPRRAPGWKRYQDKRTEKQGSKDTVTAEEGLCLKAGPMEVKKCPPLEGGRRSSFCAWAVALCTSVCCPCTMAYIHEWRRASARSTFTGDRLQPSRLLIPSSHSGVLISSPPSARARSVLFPFWPGCPFFSFQSFLSISLT